VKVNDDIRIDLYRCGEKMSGASSPGKTKIGLSINGGAGWMNYPCTCTN
jgi:hypothetical protein